VTATERPPPKSTGRERFNTDWLAAAGVDRYPVADVQATLTELTARTIADGIERWCEGAKEVFACGGGVHNADLMRRLQARLGYRTLATTDILGVPADWVEAVAFAWLARQTLLKAPGNIPEVTGAAGSRVLGAIYPA
jgi:anhydro-N-acetylmuramic acid kinase